MRLFKIVSKITIFFIILLGIKGIGNAANKITIITEHEDPVELEVKYKLEELIGKYPIERFLFTKKIIIDKSVWPAHSHPILTIPGRKLFVDDEQDLLANFLHEQFHWSVIENGILPFKDRFILLKSEFPGINSAPPFGSGDEASTYSHIIVCYLEYKALSHFLGDSEAMLMIKSKKYYTSVYSLISDKRNHSVIEDIIFKIGGNLWPLE